MTKRTKLLIKMRFKELQELFIRSRFVKIPGVMLFGPPGIGKGTFARLIANDFNLLHISPGSLMRKLVKDQDIQNDAKLEYIQLALTSNTLPREDITMDLVVREYERNKSQYKGVIFDGFPRTKSYIPLMKEKFDLKKFVMVELGLNEKILQDRLLARRECGSCHRTYNMFHLVNEVYSMPAILPKTEGQCDGCGGKLVQREDDTPAIIQERFKKYKSETIEVMNQLELEEGLAKVSFEIKKGVDDYAYISKLIEEAIFKNGKLNSNENAGSLLKV
jgi:adenylate kinase